MPTGLWSPQVSKQMTFCQMLWKCRKYLKGETIAHLSSLLPLIIHSQINIKTYGSYSPLLWEPVAYPCCAQWTTSSGPVLAIGDITCCKNVSIAATGVCISCWQHRDQEMFLYVLHAALYLLHIIAFRYQRIWQCWRVGELHSTLGKSDCFCWLFWIGEAH